MKTIVLILIDIKKDVEFSYYKSPVFTFIDYSTQSVIIKTRF